MPSAVGTPVNKAGISVAAAVSKAGRSVEAAVCRAGNCVETAFCNPGHRRSDLQPMTKSIRNGITNQRFLRI